ncbi:MAG: metallophosphoesterase family protein [Pseudomonadota bacterium]
MSKRSFAIGDIHGDIRALEALIECLDLQKDDQLIFLGDYIDRGPASREVIDFLLKLEQRHDCVFLRGNHEATCLFALTKHDPNDDGYKAIVQRWIDKGGGQAMLESYGALTIEDLVERIPQSHVDFLERTQNIHESKDHVFVHASYDPRLPSHEQEARTLRMVFMANAKPTEHFNKEIVCGHSALMTGKPAQKEAFICIDTVAEGWLTAYDLRDKKFYQSSGEGISRKIDRPCRFSMDRHVPTHAQ